jgi:hypothetical protein
LVNTGTAWAGGSDQGADEGVWRWVEGPEAGQQFWTGDVNGTAFNGAYENWTDQQPFAGSVEFEDYLSVNNNGEWNDLRADHNPALINYVVEYSTKPSALSRALYQMPIPATRSPFSLAGRMMV